MPGERRFGARAYRPASQPLIRRASRATFSQWEKDAHADPLYALSLTVARRRTFPRSRPEDTCEILALTAPSTTNALYITRRKGKGSLEQITLGMVSRRYSSLLASRFSMGIDAGFAFVPTPGMRSLASTRPPSTSMISNSAAPIRYLRTSW